MDPAEAEELQARHDELVARLVQHEDNPALDASQRELAGAWRRRLESLRERALAPLTMAFMAKVGCGKTTAIAAATGLRLDGVGLNPKKWSVLPVDDGRTTVGDTVIELEDREDIVLEVEPVGARELTTELRLFAEDTWNKHRGEGKARGTGGVGEEFYRLLRNWIAPDSDDPRAEIRALVEAAESFDGFRVELALRVDVEARTQGMTRDYAADDEGLTALRGDLRALMRGKLGEAPAPEAVRLRIPRGELGPEPARLVDTRGIDSDAPKLSIRGRPDIQRQLFEPDTLLVVGSEFASAPDVVSRELITALTRDELGREQSFRLLLVHRLDADTDERAEQLRVRKERIEECQDQLRHGELPVLAEHVVALDARCEVDALRQFVTKYAVDERGERIARWAKTCEEAHEALAMFADVEFATNAREWDLRLWWAWDVATYRASQTPPPMPQEHFGLFCVAAAIRHYAPRAHWSHLYAATRRRGAYTKLHLAPLGAVVAGAAMVHAEVAGTNAISQLTREIGGALDQRLSEHLEARADQFRMTVLEYVGRASARWQIALQAYFDSPEADELWSASVSRKGRGEGYITDIARLFDQEAANVVLHPGGLPDPKLLVGGLPPRPRLFRLHRVAVQNFRAITHQALILDPHLTVLVGDNGEGKTTWLEVVAAGVGAVLPAMDSGEPAPVIDAEVRQTKALIDGILDIQPQPPMAIELTVSLQGHELEWSRTRATMSSAVETSGAGMQVIAEQIAKEIRSHSNRQLPVFAYYGTERLWPPDLEPREAEDNRFEGYRSCLDPASTHERAWAYVEHYTLAGLQRSKPFPQVEAICAAVVACVPGAVEFRWDLQRKDFLLVMETGEPQLFGQLSDGYRNIVGLVADIAWRAVRLNPQLGARAPALAEGIVLIDEIDLHLHPRWQRHVLADLRRAFPKLQFLTTTHSPFIIQSLEPGQLRNLAPDAQHYDYAHASPEDITEHVMGVELPQRSHRREREAEVAQRYYALLDEIGDADDARLIELERELDELSAPYADNQAFVAQLRREYLVAKSEREASS